MKKAIGTSGKFILFFVVWAAGVSLVFSLYEKPPTITHQSALLRLYWEAAPLAMVIVCTVLAVTFLEKKKISVIITKRPFKDTLLGLAFGIGWIASVTLILLSLGILTFDSSTHVSALPIWGLALFLNAAMEELLIRGYLFSMVRSAYSSVAAVIVTTALFLALHGGAFDAGVIAILNVITMSLFVSLLLLWTEGLWAVIVAHYVWNMIAGVIMNGISLPADYPNVLQVSLHGPPLAHGRRSQNRGRHCHPGNQSYLDRRHRFFVTT